MPPKFLPPPGYTYEGIHGQSNGIRMLVASVVTLSLAGIVYLLRMVVKIFIIQFTNWEDYFATAALLLSVARTIMLALSE